MSVSASRSPDQNELHAQPVSPAAVRETILGMLHSGKAGHLGTSMSLVEMLIAAYASSNISKIKERRPDRDRIIVSKGHGAAATYAVMHHYGLLGAEGLSTYYQNGSMYCGHVSHGVDFVEHSTGALGHGLPVGCGCALGLRSRGYLDARVFVLVGDGELQEGSVWEALMFASHNALSNLTVMVDNNRISSITYTDQVINMNPLAQRFTGFGLEVREVDGHNVEEIMAAITSLREAPMPGVIICNTTKGYGVPFAEDKAIWHYSTLSDKLHAEALAHVRKGATR